MIDTKTLGELKAKLIKEQEDLERDLGKIARKEADGEYEAKFDEIGRSPEENAEEVEEYTVNMGITDTLEKKLSEIKDALKKMEKGTYGICGNCNKEIPLERLKAYPSAKLCLDCSK